MGKLVEFIQSNPDPRELKRALAVQMVLKGYLYCQIAEILQVSDSYVSKWWLVFEAEGVMGLQLSYQGSKGYLNAEQRQVIINWLQQKNYWNLTQLQQHIQNTYSIKFKSRQSYYELFALCGHQLEENPKVQSEKSSRVGAKKN